MLVINWKHQLLLLCLAKIMKKNCWSGASNKIKTRLVNLQDCVWENHCRRLKPFFPKKPTEFCFCLCTVIELIVVCRRVVSEQITTAVSSSSSVATVVQSSAEVEQELLLFNSDSWTDAQQPNPCTPTVIQGFAEHVSLPTDDPIEDFSEEHMATGSMASAGKSPNKHPRTGSEEDKMDIAALLDHAADRFSACMDTKVDSMMDRLEKRIDEKIDSKFGLVMDRLSVLDKTSSSTRCGSYWRYSCSICPSYLEIKGWCGFRDKNTHGLTEAQA